MESEELNRYRLHPYLILILTVVLMAIAVRG